MWWLQIEEFGVTETRDLKPNGRNLIVAEENKQEYVHLVCQMKMTGAIRKQIDSFLEGFYDIIPKKLIGIFNEQEMELLIAGLPTIDVDDLKANTEYHKYQSNSLQVIERDQLTLISPGGGGGGGLLQPPFLKIVCDKSAARIGLAAWFHEFFPYHFAYIFWDQTCDVRVYGYKVA